MAIYKVGATSANLLYGVAMGNCTYVEYFFSQMNCSYIGGAAVLSGYLEHGIFRKSTRNKTT